MYYTDDSLYPENMQPLIITAAPYGPTWLPGDAADIAVTWDEQVQAAVDCYNAGATVLHFHVRNPATGHLSADYRPLQLPARTPQESRARNDHAGRRLDRLLAQERRREGRVAGLRHASHARGTEADTGDRHGRHRHLHDRHHADVDRRMTSKGPILRIRR